MLQGLENIDDDAERQDVHLVKTTDTEFAEKMGIEADEIPAIIFFNEQMPNLFDGDISAEEEVLDWLIEQNVESHIDLVTKPMLEEMIEEIQYLVVFFCKLRLIKFDFAKAAAKWLSIGQLIISLSFSLNSQAKLSNM